MNRKLILKTVAAIFATVFCLLVPANVSSQPFEPDFSDTNMSYDEFNNYVLGEDMYFIDNGYDVMIKTKYSVGFYRAWDMWYDDNIDGYSIDFLPDFVHDQRIKIPDSFKFKGIRSKTKVISIKGSCPFKEFDLDPQNKYMTLVDNVVFSKDKKTLMSYAQFDERIYYEVPEGTETIGAGALSSCNNIREIYLPESVTDIKSAFGHMNNLEKINIPPLTEEIRVSTFSGCGDLNEVYIPENSMLKKISENAFCNTEVTELTLPSFDIRIDRAAFGTFFDSISKIKLKSHDQLELHCNENTIKWDRISDTS